MPRSLRKNTSTDNNGNDDSEADGDDMVMTLMMIAIAQNVPKCQLGLCLRPTAALTTLTRPLATTRQKGIGGEERGREEGIRKTEWRER